LRQKLFRRRVRGSQARTYLGFSEGWGGGNRNTDRIAAPPSLNTPLLRNSVQGSDWTGLVVAF